MRIVIAALLLAPLALAQDSDELFEQHVHTIDVKDGTFSGPGLEWIVKEAESCQFVVFGEQHNVTEIPAFVETTQARIHDQGFHYLALEMGPVAAETFSTISFEDAVARNPFAVAFDNDSDLNLVRESLARFDAPGRAIWGLDQAFSSIHLLEALLPLAPNEEAKIFVRSCLATVHEERRDYIRRDHFDDVTKLRELFDSPKAARYIDTLETSMRMYTNWRKGQDGHPTLYLNLSEREGYMKDRFMAEYNHAIAEGASAPKVIVKLGGAHVMPGIGMNRVLTFGTFAEEFARSMGSDSLTIGIWTYNTVPMEAPLDEWFGESNGFLIDLAALRPFAPTGALGILPDNLKRSLYGYDAVVILRETSRAPTKMLRTQKSAKTKELRRIAKEFDE